MKIKIRITIALILIAIANLNCKKGQLIEESKLAAEQKLNIAYGENAKQDLDLYLPAKRNESTKIVFLIHGGFWSGGDKRDVSMYAQTLQNSGYAVANINYRLAGNGLNPHPAQINDIAKAINYVTSKSAEWRISDSKICLIGASAGGHLALLYAYAFNSDNRVKAVVSIAGPTNLTDRRNASEIQKLIISNFLGKTPQQDSLIYLAASPISHVSTLSKPTLLIHGDQDRIVPYLQATDLKVKLDLSMVPNELYTVEMAGHDNVISPANTIVTFGKIVSWVDTYVK